MVRLLRLLAVLLNLPLVVSSQDSLGTASYFRVDAENDVYQRRRDVTDRYYTNGLRLTLLSNYWHHWPTRYLLPIFRRRADQTYDRLYDFTLGQEIYTPRSIRTPRFREIPVYYDRPYAGYLFAAWGLTTSDAVGGRKLTTSITLGVIGPLSLAAEGQMGLHQLIRNRQPLGWNKQLKNDPVVSYYARYEGRPLGWLSRSLDLIGAVEGNVGTLTNYLGAGLMLRFGRFNDYFQSATGLYDPRLSGQSAVGRISGSLAGQRPFQFYTFVRPTFRVVADNALLQGGWLNRSREPYAVPASQIRHGNAQLEVGGAIAWRGFQLSYSIVRRGREYNAGEGQQWGRIATVWRW